MNNLDLTRWLLKVRNALAEQDEIKRNSMLRAADSFLKGKDQKREGSEVARIPQDTNRRTQKGKGPRTNPSSRSKRSHHGKRIN